MLRRRGAALAGRAWAALPSAAGSGGGAIGSSGATVQHSLAPAAGAVATAVSDGAAVRWRHVLSRAAGRAQGAAQQQQRSAAAAHSWRVASWQQIRQQWSDPR